MAQKNGGKRSDVMRSGNGLSDGLREDAKARSEAGLRQHAEMASKLLVDYGLSKERTAVALTAISRFASIEVRQGERRTASALRQVREEFLADESFKKLSSRDKSIASRELTDGLGAAKQALQEAFDQKDSWPALVAA